MHHRNRNRKLKIAFWPALIFAACAAVWVCAGTSAGSEWLIRKVALQRVPAEAASIARVEGALWGELVLRDVEIVDPRGLPPGSRVRAQRVRADLRAFLRAGEKIFAAERVRVSVPGYVRTASAERAEWSSLRGVTVRDLEAAGLPRVPDSATLKVQRVNAPFPPPESGFRLDEVHNARLKLPNSEPVVFFGKYSKERVDMNFYSRSASVRDLVRLFRIKPLARTTGQLTALDMRVSGDPREPNLNGEFRVERLKHDTMSLQNAPGTFKLAMRRIGGKNKFTGRLDLESGQLTLKGISMYLEPSRFKFAGDLDMPRLKVRAKTKIEEVKINILIEGTKDDPELKLTSDPPLHEDNLMLMLATGKRWTGTEKALADERVSPDAAKEFIDYFVFGGSGERLANALGIDEVSLRYDEEERGVEVKKKVTSNVGLVYGVNQPGVVDETEEDPARQEIMHKIGAEYRLTDSSSVAVEGQRTLRAENRTAGTTLAESKEANEKLLLKFDRRF